MNNDELLLALSEMMDQKLESVKDDTRKHANLVLGELDRVEQRIYDRFDKVDKDMQVIREDIHTTRYSNETVELLLKKVTELEKRITELEKTA